MNKPEFYVKLRKYAVVNNKRAIMQMITSIIPYLAIFVIMYWLLMHKYPYLIVLLLAIINAGFMARVFIIFHDCTHNAFFRSINLNRVVGHFCGILTFTPFHEWQLGHKIHHATSSNLDKRGTGDLYTMTLNEYYSKTRLKKFFYALFRNPFFLFIIAPPVKFIILNRIPKNVRRNRELVSSAITTVALALIIFLSWRTIGIRNYVMIQLPVIWIGSSIGFWLFFIQHQFENVYWSRNAEWNPFKAAMEGASFYKLPGILRWFTGNIGYHHLHHILLNIPCYYLKDCYEDVRLDEPKISLTLKTGFKSVYLKLYDEETKKLLSFGKARELIKVRTLEQSNKRKNACH
jgi:omega-6 fatty acid desaturase (delta-12 desaturase)